MNTKRCLLCQGETFYTVAKIQKYDLSMCTKCTFLSLYPLPTEEELQRYYTAQYRTQISSAEAVSSTILAAEQARSDRIIPLVRLHASKIKNCLDIGCSTGTLLKNINDGFGKEVECHGLEFNDNYRKYAVSKAHISADEYAYNMPIEQLHFENKISFDFISLVHVLEHMRNPLSALESIWGLLSDDGLFYIEVPNLKTPYGSLKKNYFTIYHLHYFSDKTLRQFLNKCGFEVLETKVQARTSISFLCKKAISQEEFGENDSYKDLVKRLRIYEMVYPFKNTVFVIARYFYRKVFK